MWTMASPQSNKSMAEQLAERFRNADTSKYPNFTALKKPLERGLWILAVAKDLKTSELTAQEIVFLARKVCSVSIPERAMANALNRAGDKVHLHKKVKAYEIMQPGVEFLTGRDMGIDLIYFEPGKKFSTGKLLSEKLLDVFTGELRIVDPYLGERTLDLLSDKDREIKVLTRLDNIANKTQLLSKIKNFCAENPKVEFRDYTAGNHIHDRFIISGNYVALLGCSLSGIGNKESFALALKISSNQDVAQVLSANFNTRWNSSSRI